MEASVADRSGEPGSERNEMCSTAWQLEDFTGLGNELSTTEEYAYI
jgi:hypothetical protein